MESAVVRMRQAVVARMDLKVVDMVTPDSRRPLEVLLLWELPEWKNWALGRALSHQGYLVCRAVMYGLRFDQKSESSLPGFRLTSLVLRLGVDRDELDPDREGGLSFTPFRLLEPALSLPFKPTLSRSRFSSDA